MTEITNKQLNNCRLEYIDNIKAIAILMVIFLHSYSLYCYNYPNLKTLEFCNMLFWDSLVRSCVPLFLIATGINILGKNYSTKKLIKDKIFIRLCIPYIFYGLVYCILMHKSLKAFLSPGEIYYHFYFFSIILIIYILQPILSKFAQRSSMQECIYIFVLITLILFIKTIGVNFTLFDLNILFLPASYSLLGYFANKFDTKKYIYLNLAIFLLCVLITCALTYFISKSTGGFNEKYFEYLSLNIFIMSFSLFFLLKNIKPLKNNILIKIRNFIAIHSYGIFFLHPLIQQNFYHFAHKHFPYLYGFVVFALTSTITITCVYLCIQAFKFLKIDKLNIMIG